MATTPTPNAFARIGAIFNDATNRFEGGVSNANRDAIADDLNAVQTRLEALIQQQPNLFAGVTAIHAQNIVDQIKLETSVLHSIGTDPYAAKELNDIQRDIIDIVQGDGNLSTLATQHGGNGFAAVPGLLASPAPFHLNAEQTAFLQKFVVDSGALGQQALAAVGTPAAGQVAHDVAVFMANANNFAAAQGGLYSARFSNELTSDGVAGTASRALIHGLTTGNADQVQAAATVLAQNATDVQGNQLPLGTTPPPTTNPIPTHIDTFAEAGTIFNDATTKLIGGVFDGTNNDGNRQSILNDLSATQTGLKGLLITNPAAFQGASAQHVQVIINDLAKEMALVSATGAGNNEASQIGAFQKQIIAIVQHDTTLQSLAAANGAAGFQVLPPALHHDHVTSHESDVAAHVFTSTADHLWG